MIIQLAGPRQAHEEVPHSLDDSAVPIAYSLTMPAALDLVTVPHTLMQQLLVAV